MSNTATVITTKAGEALIAQMQAENKVLVIDKFIFANVPNRPAFPNRDDVVPTEHVVHESAVHEQGRLTENSVIYSTTLASNVGPFSFNWSGLFCSEHNVLVAINFPPPVDKTVDAPGITGNTLVRSFVLEYKGIAETTNITVDPSSWQYDAHKRMSKMDNDTAQAIIDQNGKDWFIDDGFIVTPQSGAYSIKAGAGYVSGHRISLDFDRIIQVPEKPAFIYVDAFREGSPTGEWQTKFTFVVAADEKDDYTDAQGVNHFVCKIAQVFEDGSVGDLRRLGNDVSSSFVNNGFSKRPLSKKYHNAETIKDFGGKGDGVHDDTDAAYRMIFARGFLRVDGINRITRRLTIENDFDVKIIGDGMFSETTYLLIDHDDWIFAHGKDNFESNGLLFKDLRVRKKLYDEIEPSEDQHFYVPISANGWKEFKNILVEDVGGLMFAYPGDGIDVYCQRWEVNNFQSLRCGAWSGILGDATVPMMRPLGTIATLNNIDLKSMRGCKHAISWFDNRGWRQVRNNSTVEIGYTSKADKHTQITSVIAIKSNSPVSFDTIWLEPYPNTKTNITDIIFCDKYPASNVDGESGTVVSIKNIEATRQGKLVHFVDDVYYDVHVGILGSTYSYYIQPQHLINWGTDLLRNKNKVTIDHFFWRYEDNKPLLPFPIPRNMYGNLTIKKAATNTNSVHFPQMEFNESPTIYEWYASANNVRPDNESVTTAMMSVNLSEYVDSVSFAQHKGMLALNVLRNDGVPRVRYLVKASSDYFGAWCTVAVNYVHSGDDVSSGIPFVISNSNGDGANAKVINANYENGTGYSTAIIVFQIQKAETRLDAYFSGEPEVGRNQFYIQSIKANLGTKVDLDLMGI